LTCPSRDRKNSGFATRILLDRVRPLQSPQPARCWLWFAAPEESPPAPGDNLP
jgi:hypothetical protein